MAVDSYEPRTMVAALEIYHPPTTFLLDTFFKDGGPIFTPHMDIDIERGKRKLAKFTSPNQKAAFVERSTYKTVSVKFPYIKQIGKLTPQDLINRRSAGNHLYSRGVSDAMQIMDAQETGKVLRNLADDIMRLEEYMAAQALSTGKISIVGTGVNAEVDYEIPATQLIDVGSITAWDAVGNDPLKNLADWMTVVKNSSGLVPDICIMGTSAMNAFLNNASVLALLDKLNVQIGRIEPSKLEKGVQHIGYLNTPGTGIDLYTYTGVYEDDNDVVQYFVNPKHVLLGSTKARANRYYGPIYRIDSSTGESVPAMATQNGRFAPKSWIDHDPNVRWIMVESSPLPALHQSDAFLRAAVLA